MSILPMPPDWKMSSHLFFLFFSWKWRVKNCDCQHLFEWIVLFNGTAQHHSTGTSLKTYCVAGRWFHSAMQYISAHTIRWTVGRRGGHRIKLNIKTIKFVECHPVSPIRQHSPWSNAIFSNNSYNMNINGRCCACELATSVMCAYIRRCSRVDRNSFLLLYTHIACIQIYHRQCACGHPSSNQQPAGTAVNRSQEEYCFTVNDSKKRNYSVARVCPARHPPTAPSHYTLHRDNSFCVIVVRPGPGDMRCKKNQKNEKAESGNRVARYAYCSNGPYRNDVIARPQVLNETNRPGQYHILVRSIHI